MRHRNPASFSFLLLRMPRSSGSLGCLRAMWDKQLTAAFLNASFYPHPVRAIMLLPAALTPAVLFL